MHEHMKVIVDRIEGDIAVVEADEAVYKLPLALCRDAKEGDTVEITVIGREKPEEEPHAIFERLRKSSRKKESAASKPHHKQ